MSSTPPPYQPPPQQGQGPYGEQGAHPPPGWMRPPDHPRAQTVLILGILSLALCQILGPFAWSQGTTVLREIDASGGRVGGRDTANIGRVLGIVSTVLLIVGLLMVVAVFVVQVLVIGGMALTT